MVLITAVSVLSTEWTLNTGTAREQMGHWELNPWWCEEESWLIGPGLDFLNGDESLHRHKPAARTYPDDLISLTITCKMFLWQLLMCKNTPERRTWGRGKWMSDNVDNTRAAAPVQGQEDPSCPSLWAGQSLTAAAGSSSWQRHRLGWSGWRCPRGSCRHNHRQCEQEMLFMAGTEPLCIDLSNDSSSRWFGSSLPRPSALTVHKNVPQNTFMLLKYCWTIASQQKLHLTKSLSHSLPHLLTTLSQSELPPSSIAQKFLSPLNNQR